MGDNTRTTERTECPIERDEISAETREGLAVRLIEHYVQKHPGGLPPAVGGPIQTVLEELKARYH